MAHFSDDTPESHWGYTFEQHLHVENAKIRSLHWAGNLERHSQVIKPTRISLDARIKAIAIHRNCKDENLSSQE